MYNYLKSILLIAIIPFSLIGQKSKSNKYSQCHIIYDIQINGVKDLTYLADKSKLDVYIKDNSSRMNINVLGGMASFSLIHNQLYNEYAFLMDVPSFYEKAAVNIDNNISFLEKIINDGDKNKTPVKHPDITYYKSKQRKIAGLNCTYAIMESGNSNAKIKFYLTDKINTNIFENLNAAFGRVKGFPLMIEMEIEGIKIILSAEEIIRKRIDASTFDIPENFSKKSLEQLIKEVNRKLNAEDQKISKL